MRDISYWRMKRALYRLEGNHCQRCGMLHFPQRIVCSICHTPTVPALSNPCLGATNTDATLSGRSRRGHDSGMQSRLVTTLIAKVGA